MPFNHPHAAKNLYDIFIHETVRDDWKTVKSGESESYENINSYLGYFRNSCVPYGCNLLYAVEENVMFTTILLIN